MCSVYDIMLWSINLTFGALLYYFLGGGGGGHCF